MSLVAYDDGSSSDGEIDEPESKSLPMQTKSMNATNGHISDDDDFYVRKQTVTTSEKRGLHLPAPTKITTSPDNELDKLFFTKLPIPKMSSTSITFTDHPIEEDDEFLQKKSIPVNIKIEKPPPPPKTRVPVKIQIPSLSQFKDLTDNKPLQKADREPGSSEKKSGLLNLLPKPKKESVFDCSWSKNKASATITSATTITSLVPDSVKNHQFKTTVARSTSIQPLQSTILLQNCSESEDENTGDEDSHDFFSLNNTNDSDLPQVSQDEINAMVAKQAAKMSKISSEIDKIVNIPTSSTKQENSSNESYVYHEVAAEAMEIDQHAIRALVGSRARKRKMEEVNIVELSTADVLPDKDEWLRTALASSTEYQPKGVLADEEPAPGTRKKHQITYLAHQAKTNELELQAMWSANRHTRRQTQSKYGF